jgi:hypothetical protein
MKSEDNNRLRQHNYWVAACLDIVGQTEAMKDIDFVNSQMSDEERKLFEQGVKKVYKSTQLLHDTIERWVEKSEKTPPPFQNLNDKEKQFWETTNGRPLRWQRFSDGLIVYASLADPLAQSPIRPIYFMIGGCAAAMLLLLAHETPIRGGIAMGAACEFRPNELYGPVLATAHKLESKVAGYPRVVVDNRVHEYLVGIHRSTGGGKRGDSDRAIAAHCLELLSTDVDGNEVVDYLGEGFRAHTGLSKTDPIFDKIEKFIESEYDKHRTDKNTKLAFRYALLFNYFTWRIKEA